MDWKLMGSTFIAVFLAELGDKTQLATFNLAAGSNSRWAIFIGSAAALVATSAIAVLAGEAVSRVIPPHWLKRVAGVAFVLIGVWFVLTATRPAA
ncbi:MAG TPA: TMEM165/GDT1 family protein [Myxococcaceae bacterium]|nr:TMEM165/GDT1 family protein [Myxococcaceae bacterium]